MLKTSKIHSSTQMSFIEIHRRKQIIDIALRLLAEQGYNQTTLAAVAKKAGFTKGVIFYYFKNKDELIDQINTVLLEELREYTKARVKSRDSEKEKLKAYLRAYFDYMKENTDRFMILFELGINFNTRKQDPLFSPSIYVECRRRLDRVLEVDKVLVDHPQLKSDTLTTVIQGMLDGIGIQFITDPKSIDLDDCYQMVTDMIDTYLKSKRRISSF